MFNKRCLVYGLLLVLAAAPLASSAMASSTALQQEARAKIMTERQKTKDFLATATVNRIVAYTKATVARLNQAIERGEKTINQLSQGSSSIIAKLEAKDINTDSIKTKLTNAQTVFDQATTELQAAAAKAGAAASTASSTAKKSEYLSIRADFRTVISTVKQAQQKLKEALKMIKEVPGIKDIRQGTSSTTVATSTSD